MNAQSCNHSWEKVGNWDGWDQEGTQKINIGGPVVLCSKCGEKKKIKHSDWNKFKSENLIANNA
jgi:hypothetical protein